jgi:hypothetical protein
VCPRLGPWAQTISLFYAAALPTVFGLAWVCIAIVGVRLLTTAKPADNPMHEDKEVMAGTITSPGPTPNTVRGGDGCPRELGAAATRRRRPDARVKATGRLGGLPTRAAALFHRRSFHGSCCTSIIDLQ